MSDIACCWISAELLVEFTSMITNGNKLRTVRRIQNEYANNLNA